MKTIKTIFLSAILMLTFAIGAMAQLTGPKNIPGDYADLAAAVTDLNAQGVGAGGVTFNLAAGNPQTAPAGGYVIGGTGSAVLTTASAANPIVFNGNGNTITAPTPQASGALTDAIFKLIGADWTTISGFSMTENAANTTTAAATNNMTEWGVALLYVTITDGAQNNTISGNTIDLNRTYANTFGIYSNSTHSATAVTTSVTATGAAGSNAPLTITGNNITDVNIGIAVIGPTASADHNDGLTIGGTAPNANILTNYGTTGTFSTYANVSGTVNGILVRNTKNYNISFNSITSSSGATGVTAGTLRGIFVPTASNPPTGTFTNNVNNNTLAVTSHVLAGAINGITVEVTTSSATSTTNIDNNNFTTLNHTIAAATGTITAITESGAATAGPLVTSVSNNTFTNITSSSTGSFTFLSPSFTGPTNAIKNFNNNSVVTAFNKTGAGGTVTFFNDGGSDTAGSVINTNNNSFTNVTVTGATAVTGIFQNNGGAPTKIVNNNTIGNITGGTSTILGIPTNFDGGTTTVTNNTVSNIAGGGIINGIQFGTSGVGTVNASQNTVHTLTGSGTGAVTGISIGGSATAGTTKNVFGNKIYNLENNNAAGATNGVAIISGAAINLYNNLIGNLRTPAVSAANALNGINITSTTAVSNINVSFNTVYLNASSTGANFGSSALAHTTSTTATTASLTLRNNILVNLSTPSGTGVTTAYRRSSTTLTNYNAASNNNLFYAGMPSATNLIFFDGTNSDTTLAAYKARVTPRDSASVTENPSFLSTTGSDATFLHINPAVATQVESGGTPVAGITIDFDGDTRNGSTPDIGADEFTGTPLDLVGPSITYTPFLNSSSAANRTLTVTITDPSGIAGGMLAPRIYFKKTTDASYVSTQCTGASPTYMCTIDYTLVGGGSVMTGDMIQYFVVAQDTAGNVSANPSGGFAATDVNNVTTPPTTPNQYAIAVAVSGSFNVGAGETYTSLTNAGGIFEFINNNDVTGDITINITSDLSAASGTLVAETGAVALNQFASPHTILIKPSGGTRLVNGPAASTALIRLNGASRVTIDGSLSGGTDRSLTIENTSTTAPQVVRFGSIGAAAITANTLKNTTIINGINTSSAVIVTDNAGTAGTFNAITIQNNDIQKAFIGIFTNAAVGAGNGNGLMITQNKLDTSGANAIRSVGVYVQGADGATVSNNMVGNLSNAEGENDTGIWLTGGTVNTMVSSNTVSNLGMTLTTGFAPFGIRDSGGAAASGNSIVGNTVSNISTNGTTQVYGIENSSGGALINRNKVQGINNLSTNTYGAYGINVTSGNNVIIRNNFVSNVTGDMTSGSAFSTTFGIFGIRILAGTGHQIYHNSVNLYGLRAGTANSSLLTAALGVVSTASTGMDVRNNIFANNITGGTTSVANVSVYLPSGGTSAMNLTMNKNAYFYGTDAATQGVGQAGTTAGTNFFATLPALAAYTSTLHAAATNDNASQAYTTAPPFVSDNDLHLNVSTSPLLSAGDSIGSVTVDIDLDPRPATNPDIGADEVVQSVGGVFPAGTYYNAVTAPGDTLGGDVTITSQLTLNGILDAGMNTLTLDCNATVSGASATNFVVGNVRKNFCAIGSFTYPVGDNSGTAEYSPLTANVTALGINPSSLTVNVVDLFLSATSPTQSISRYWDLTEAGDLTADISYTYLDADVNGDETTYNVIRREGSTSAIYPGGTVNAATNTATAPGVTMFSQWGAGNLAPLAASAEVGGRVVTSTGRGVAGARVFMTDGQGNVVMRQTNTSGYYRFTEVEVGGTYVLGVNHKTLRFAQPSLTLVVNDTNLNVNFIANGLNQDRSDLPPVAPEKDKE